MKYRLMKAQAKEFKIERMSQVFEVSSSGTMLILSEKYLV